MSGVIPVRIVEDGDGSGTLHRVGRDFGPNNNFEVVTASDQRSGGHVPMTRAEAIALGWSGGGYTPQGNVGWVMPSGSFATPGALLAGTSYGIGATFFTFAEIMRAAAIVPSYSTSTAWDFLGIAYAPTSDVSAALGSVGSFNRPDQAAVQLTVAGATAGASPLATAGPLQNYTIGDWVDVTASSAPVVDATNNPRGRRMGHIRAEGLTGALYAGVGQKATNQLTDLAAVGGEGDAGVMYRTVIKSAATGSGTAAGFDAGSSGYGFWDFAAGPAVGMLVECSTNVLRVLGTGDSIAAGAYSSGTNFDTPYQGVAARLADSAEVPVFFASTAISGAADVRNAAEADRFIDQVGMPDVVILQPSQNGGGASYDFAGGLGGLRDVAARVRAAGGWTIWIVGIPHTGLSAGTLTRWETTRTSTQSVEGALDRTIVIDMSRVLADPASAPEFEAPIAGEYDAGLVHPFGKLHYRMANLVAAALRTILQAIA